MANSEIQQAEAQQLAALGRHVFAQDLRVPVRLSAELANCARDAWKRDGAEDPEPENPAQRAARDQAGTLALIGLAVEERGVAMDGGDVMIDIDAWHIGNALNAADRLGLLAGVRSRDSDS